MVAEAAAEEVDGPGFFESECIKKMGLVQLMMTLQNYKNGGGGGGGGGGGWLWGWRIGPVGWRMKPRRQGQEAWEPKAKKRESSSWWLRFKTTFRSGETWEREREREREKEREEEEKKKKKEYIRRRRRWWWWVYREARDTWSHEERKRLVLGLREMQKCLLKINIFHQTNHVYERVGLYFVEGVSTFPITCS